MSTVNIQPEEVRQIESYAAEVAGMFGLEFDKQSARFNNGKYLLERFDDAVASMLARGRTLISGVDETHNELCVANRLLASTDPRLASLEYEPVISECGKSIDFRARTDEGITLYVDAKTIKPKPKDRWEQFEKARSEGWFPKNVHLALSKDRLGPELWHNMFAARSRMLEYTIELEAKIRGCEVQHKNTFFILFLCGEGFQWHEDELEDFVSFYRSGVHRGDDPFSKVEAKYIEDTKIKLDRTIARFACMSRGQFEIWPRRLVWNVEPPRFREG